MKTIFAIFVSLLVLSCSLGFSQTNRPAMPSMVLVEGGTFVMGNNAGNQDEQPEHKVTVNSFYIGKYEVTFAEFKKFIDATGYLTDSEQPDTVRLKHNLPPRALSNGTWNKSMHGDLLPLNDSLKPVGNISWNDAVAYCIWLSKMTGKKFRLPTEAEWEYAAKGGSLSKGYKYVGGNNLDEVAWYLDNARATLHLGGQKLANELGIYDMAGNMREWCSDWYGNTYYKTSPAEDPAGPERGKDRVVRGGAWGSEANRMRISYRNSEFPYNAAKDFGFRIATSSDVPKKTVPAAPAQTDLLKDLDAKGFVDIYGINFDIGKSAVKPESYPIIDQLTKYMKEHPTVRIMIEGHTDNTGDASKNQALSEKRAQSIRSEIIKRGIDAGRMEIKGFGSSKPIADNNTADGRTQNRRVTIKKL
jgi:sulfatase modifying factor 1